MTATQTDTVYCRLNIALPTKEKVSKYLSGLMEGCNIEECSIEDYPKFPGTFMASFSFILSSASNEEAVYLILKLCNKLARSNWNVNGPFEVPNFSFGCCLNNENEDKPLKWAYIAIGNA